MKLEYKEKYWIKLGDRLVNLYDSPLIMGILNVTPDSFYSDSRSFSLLESLHRVEKMVKDGADIIDIGGISTRPNADLMTEKEELERIIPVIQEIKKQFPKQILSVDTFRSQVAKKAIDFGADLINDVYGGRYDEKMIEVIAKTNTPYILMHSRGEASNMQTLCQYKDVVMEVTKELSQKVEEFREKGVKDIIIDPGFGFAKNLEQNYQLLNGLDYLKVIGCPILVGISRKSMIYKLLNSTPDKALLGTSVLNSFALLKKASIIRVHDVKEAVEVKLLLSEFNS